MDISRQQVEELTRAVLDACPDLEKTGVRADAMITAVLDLAGASVSALAQTTQRANGVGPDVAREYMAAGAIASFLDQLGPEQIQGQLYRAGRLVGKFMAEHMIENVMHGAGIQPS